MSERPGEGPDFGWLYGQGGQGGSADPDATRPIRRQERPGGPPPQGPPPPADEGTRVMPSQPRNEPYQQPPPPSRQPQPQQPQPAPGTPYRSGGGFGRRLRRPRFWVRLVLVLLALWLVYLVAVPIIAWQNVEKVDWEPDGDRPGDQPGTTYLMVGSDSRADLSEEERRELGTGNPAGNRTDTIMLLHTGDGPDLLMSIPRDSPAPDSPNGKINGAYATDGPTGLVSTVEGLTGIRVDHYVEIGMGGVVGIVDAVGGVEICPKRAIDDPKAKLRIKKGCQEADGRTALGYSRTRASSLSDLDRVQQQREVVAAIGSKVLSPWSVVNPVRYWRLNNAMPDFFVFGEGMGPVRAGQWAMAMSGVGDGGRTCTVPLAGASAEWDAERSEQMFRAIREDETDSIGRNLCTPTGLPRSVTGG